MSENKKKSYPYRFSVILPVKGDSEKVRKSFLSVKGQRFSFDQIQVIFLSAGEKWEDELLSELVKGRKNVSVVSDIKALEAVVTGRYVNVLEPGAVWEKHAFSQVSHYFQMNKELKMTACRYIFRENPEFNILSDKVTKKRIVDILQFYHYITPYSANLFWNQEFMKEQGLFEKVISTSYEWIPILRALFECQTFGQLPETELVFEEKANKPQKLEGELGIPTQVYDELFRLSEKKYGIIIRFVQFCVMFDIRNRLMQNIFEELSDEKRKEAKKVIASYLNIIHDDIVCEQVGTPPALTIYMLGLKYGRNIEGELVYRSGLLRFKNITVASLKAREVCCIDELLLEKDHICAKGILKLPIKDKELDVFAISNTGARIDYEFLPEDVCPYCFADRLGDYRRFTISLPLPNGMCSIRFMYTFHKIQKGRMAPAFAPALGFNPENCNTYAHLGTRLARLDNNILKFYIQTFKNRITAPLKYRIEQIRMSIPKKDEDE